MEQDRSIPTFEPTPEQAAQIEALVQKSWSVELRFDPETQQYMSFVPEIPVASMGASRKEAYESLEEALGLYIETLVQFDAVSQLPEPRISGLELETSSSSFGIIRSFIVERRKR